MYSGKRNNINIISESVPEIFFSFMNYSFQINIDNKCNRFSPRIPKKKEESKLYGKYKEFSVEIITVNNISNGKKLAMKKKTKLNEFKILYTPTSRTNNKWNQR